MYAVCFYEGYENSKWYENGGNAIVEELLQPSNKYGVKIFVNNFYQGTNFDEQEDVPYIYFHSIELNQLNYTLEDRLNLVDHWNSIDPALKIWGLFDSMQLKKFYWDIFKIKPCVECPVIMRGASLLCIIKRPDDNSLSEAELQYLYDFCFDRIGDRYFLMPYTDLDLRKSYKGEPLTFNKPNVIRYYKLVWTEWIWTEMKLKFAKEN